MSAPSTLAQRLMADSDTAHGAALRLSDGHRTRSALRLTDRFREALREADTASDLDRAAVNLACSMLTDWKHAQESAAAWSADSDAAHYAADALAQEGAEHAPAAFDYAQRSAHAAERARSYRLTASILEPSVSLLAAL